MDLNNELQAVSIALYYFKRPSFLETFFFSMDEANKPGGQQDHFQKQHSGINE